MKSYKQVADEQQRPSSALYGARSGTMRLCQWSVLVVLMATSGGAIADDPMMDPFPPYAGDDWADTQYQMPVTILVLDNDFAGDAPIDLSSVNIDSAPNSGTASVDPHSGAVLYTPNQGFIGSDSFQYSVSDTNGLVSNVATVSISVMKMPPYAGDDWGETQYQVPVIISILSNDFGGDAPLDPATVDVVTPPFAGTLGIDPLTGNVLYTPDSGYVGFDFFEYTISDTDGFASNSAWVAVHVTKFPPYAGDDWAETTYNNDVMIDVLANDYGGDAPLDVSSVEITCSPLYGAATVDPQTGQITYAPNTNFVGTDYFEYVVRDIDGFAGNPAAVVISVTNMPPQIFTFFAYAQSDDVWVLRGEVYDENLGVMTVYFGGIADGYSAPVQPDGSFECGILFDNGEAGLVTAQTVDELGELSNEAADEIVRY